MTAKTVVLALQYLAIISGYVLAGPDHDICKLTDTDLLKTHDTSLVSYHRLQVDETLKLTCLLGKCPGMEIAWMKEKQKLPRLLTMSSLVTIKEEELTIRRVSISTSGSYSCVAKNSSLSVTQTFIVEVEARAPLENFYIKEGPLDQTVVEGQNATLNCLMDKVGSIPFAFLWLKDGKVIPEGKSVTWNITKESTSLRLISINLKEVSRMDGGIYTCAILGYYGRILSAQAKLRVKRRCCKPLITLPVRQ